MFQIFVFHLGMGEPDWWRWREWSSGRNGYLFDDGSMVDMARVDPPREGAVTLAMVLVGRALFSPPYA